MEVELVLEAEAEAEAEQLMVPLIKLPMEDNQEQDMDKLLHHKSLEDQDLDLVPHMDNQDHQLVNFLEVEYLVEFHTDNLDQDLNFLEVEFQVEYHMDKVEPQEPMEQELQDTLETMELDRQD